MKCKKIFLGISTLCFVIIGIFCFNVNNSYIDTQLAIYVKSLSGEDSLALDSDSSKTQFYLEIVSIVFRKIKILPFGSR